MSCTGMVGSKGGAVGRFDSDGSCSASRWRSWIRGAVDARDLTRIDTHIGAIQVGVADEDLAAAALAADRLRRTLADLRPLA